MVAIITKSKLKSIAIIAAGMAAVAMVVITYVFMWQSPSDIIFSTLLVIVIPFSGFWLFAWQLDARFTARNWQYVMKGYESNVMLNTIARHLTYGRAWPTLVLHAAFTFIVACSMAAIVVSVMPVQVPVAAPAPRPLVSAVLASAFLALFGTGHIDAYLGSKEFLSSAALL